MVELRKINKDREFSFSVLFLTSTALVFTKAILEATIFCDNSFTLKG